MDRKWYKLLSSKKPKHKLIRWLSILFGITIITDFLGENDFLLILMLISFVLSIFAFIDIRMTAKKHRSATIIWFTASFASIFTVDVLGDVFFSVLLITTFAFSIISFFKMLKRKHTERIEKTNENDEIESVHTVVNYIESKLISHEKIPTQTKNVVQTMLSEIDKNLRDFYRCIDLLNNTVSCKVYAVGKKIALEKIEVLKKLGQNENDINNLIKTLNITVNEFNNRIDSNAQISTQHEKPVIYTKKELNYIELDIPVQELLQEEETNIKFDYDRKTLVEKVCNEQIDLNMKLKSIETENFINAPKYEESMFYEMRRLADIDDNSHFTEIFYKQAVLMRDFTDNYPKIEPFSPLSSYFYSYQQLSDNQLRTYFAWRTQVRAGNIVETSLSYAFIYIYELLNQIGVENPEDGLTKLFSFWKVFREYCSDLDFYVLRWLKDYHIYYELKQTFTTFAREHELVLHYPDVFYYISDPKESFDLFSPLSKHIYNITKSKFYSTENQELIQECFHFLLDRLRTIFQVQNQVFEDLIFEPISRLREVVWLPFDRAIFYRHHTYNTTRRVELSQHKNYYCENGEWFYQKTLLTERGKQLVGYLLKAMECSLREILKFKYKIKANYDIIDLKMISRFNEVGITDLPTFVNRSVQEFYTEKTRKIITVDLGNLDRIREDALETQEKLIIPEDEQPVVIDAPVATKVEITTDIPAQNNPWVELKNLLTMVEKEALKVVLSGGWLAKFAREKLVMLEVLVDGINDKAMDTVGDAILEVEEDVLVYEEYENDVLRLVD